MIRALTVLLLLTSVAAADDRRIVAILDVHIDGVSPEIAAQFQSSLAHQIDTRRYWLAPHSRVQELMSNSTRWTDGCVVGSCLADVKTQTGADIVLLAALTGSGTSFGYVVTLVRTDTGHVVAQESQRCDVCTINEVVAQSTRATLKLLEGVPSRLPPEGADHSAELALATKPFEQKLAVTHHHHEVLGTAVLLTGLAAVAAGTALYMANSHAAYGLATAAAGGGLALGGVLVLTF